MPVLNIFNHHTITVDGDFIYSRLYASLFPATPFVEDARPDYYVKKEQFEALLLEIYGTPGYSLHKAYMSDKGLDIRVIDEYNTIFFINYYTEDDVIDRKYRISSKDLAVVNELGGMDELQEKLTKISPQDYNARPIAPFIGEEQLTDAILRVFYYPLTYAAKAVELCKAYDAIKFDRTAAIEIKEGPLFKKKKIGFLA
jgi:hypothetical protein